MTEKIISAKTIEEALEIGAAELGKTVAEINYEVVEEPKKGFLGIGATDAKVKVWFEQTVEGTAVDFLNSLIADLGTEAKAEIIRIDERESEKGTIEKDVYVEITGEGLGTLIGRHGDVLDALQYLANITAGKAQKALPDRKEYVKICLDIENYRSKREETLKQLARRKAEQAISSHRNVVLEPMLAYERRVIHAELQDFEGVYTYSVGSDNDRKVVIALGTAENPITPVYNNRRPYGRFGGNR